MGKNSSWGGFNKAPKPQAAANQFRCPHCHKRFSKSGQLTRHQIVTGHNRRPGT